ncbi:MAG: hypothetical protein QF570_05340 [Myxococcota bacterium]|jgi:crotonobetainyl-CoA:carnitine CoA-transferase CaiB-like acyl-CoA transferase|nr:hypothetical protein [Myxococcota bacterium]
MTANTLQDVRVLELGADTESVLTELLGYSLEDVRALREAKVLY